MKRLVFILFATFCIQVFAPPAENKITNEESVQFQCLFSPFTPELLKQLLEIHVLFPDIAFAQSRLETAEFTSNIFKENNNLMGMHPPKTRKTYSMGTNRHCAIYTHWYYSVLDYRLLQDYYFNKGEGMNYMLKVYCPEKNYKNKIKKLMQ